VFDSFTSGKAHDDEQPIVTSHVDEYVTDADLVAGYRRDPELFTAVYDRYVRDIYRYVAGRLGVHAADDVAAETFLVAFRQRDRFDPDRGGLRPWLFGIATNLVAHHRRKEARHYQALARCGTANPADSHEDRVVTDVAARRMQPQLARALSTLSKGERDVVLLVALSQLSNEEVAKALGIPYGTVGSRLSRARKKLRNAINQEEFDG
jgi:RNA polymerase sigma factor (sigma-70 family)